MAFSIYVYCCGSDFHVLILSVPVPIPVLLHSIHSLLLGNAVFIGFERYIGFFFSGRSSVGWDEIRGTDEEMFLLACSGYVGMISEMR